MYFFPSQGEDFAEVHQNWNASEHSKGYHSREFTRGFSRGRYPRPGPSRPPPQQFYTSEHMVSPETSGFPPPRQDSPMVPQYPFPPPMFDMHNFSLPPPPPPPPPPPSVNMGWAAASVPPHPMLNLPYSLPPPPPPPPPPLPPPPAPADSSAAHFGPYY